ncbi:MAG: glycosyltransferase family 4 protein [Tepidisphaeraceae bacterium]|jgi:glycosyltransferase involved in cell wall biosynthesis
MSQDSSHLAIDVQIDARTGWGVYGLNLALQTVAEGIQPILMRPPEWSTLHPLQGAFLMAGQAARPAGKLGCPVVANLTNHLEGTERFGQDNSAHNVAIAVFENTAINPAGLEKAKSVRTWITGSNFNAAILRHHGIPNPHVILQGVDTSLFFPGPRGELWSNCFMIFSGGKLEYRKGQDLVIAAVRAFRQRHPETVLVFAWHNAWPLTMTELPAGGLIDDLPPVHSDGRIDFAPWLRRHQIDLFLDLGSPLNWLMPAILRDMDAAIFPSRAEGATNFAAMECMACGIPTILSANTGHLDLLKGDAEKFCYPLRSQKPVHPTGFFPDVDGWGESSVDEIVENLEKIYQGRQESRRRGAAGVQAMQNIRWEVQVPEILRAIGIATNT